MCVRCSPDHTWAGSALSGGGLWPPEWKHGVKNKVRVGGRVRGGCVQWLHFCTGFCCQHLCSCRKQPWVVAWRLEQGVIREGAAVRWRLLSWSFLLLLLLFIWLCLLFLQLSSLLLFLSRGTLLLVSSSLQVWPEKVVACFGEMRAAAAPWWRPVPVLYDLLVWPQPTAQVSCSEAEEAFHQRENGTTNQ